MEFCRKCQEETGEDVKMEPHPINDEVMVCPQCGHEEPLPEEEEEPQETEKEEEAMPRGVYDRGNARLPKRYAGRQTLKITRGGRRIKSATPAERGSGEITIDELTAKLEALREGMSELQETADALNMEIVLRRKQ